MNTTDQELIAKLNESNLKRAEENCNAIIGIIDALEHDSIMSDSINGYVTLNNYVKGNLHAAITQLVTDIMNSLDCLTVRNPGVRLDHASWQAGFDAGLAGLPNVTPEGVDGLSWSSGYVEGKAARRK